MQRDIVQFVPFRQFRGHPERLARETLAEVPGQLLSYMRLHEVRPLTSTHVNLRGWTAALAPLDRQQEGVA